MLLVVGISKTEFMFQSYSVHSLSKRSTLLYGTPLRFRHLNKNNLDAC